MATQYVANFRDHATPDPRAMAQAVRIAHALGQDVATVLRGMGICAVAYATRECPNGHRWFDVSDNDTPQFVPLLGDNCYRG